MYTVFYIIAKIAPNYLYTVVSCVLLFCDPKKDKAPQNVARKHMMLPEKTVILMLLTRCYCHFKKHRNKNNLRNNTTYFTCKSTHNFRMHGITETRTDVIIEISLLFLWAIKFFSKIVISVKIIMLLHKLLIATDFTNILKHLHWCPMRTLHL